MVLQVNIGLVLLQPFQELDARDEGDGFLRSGITLENSELREGAHGKTSHSFYFDGHGEEPRAFIGKRAEVA